MIEIDGSQGEGGGQILRSALALSVVTGKAMRINRIRAGRSKPGLRAQHLQSLEAAASIASARVSGDHIGSSSVTFQPQGLHAGDFRFEIGTAGAASLVLQTIYLPLSYADGSSKLSIIGGTHVRWSPCFHYLDWQWAYFAARIGFRLAIALERAGFYPQGRGCIQAEIHPLGEISPLNLIDRGELMEIQGVSIACNLPQHIAERQRKQAIEGLQHLGCDLNVAVGKIPAFNKGSLLCLMAVFENGRGCYFGLGERGLPAERVADAAVDQLLGFIESDGCVDQYLADQILLPLAFAAGESEFRTSKITQHLVTNANIIREFTSAKIALLGEMGSSGIVRIQPVK